MRRNPAITIALLIAVAAATVWSFSVVISRRFSSGEVYPPGSTQRADPMGAKVLYEAVDRLALTTTERNFRTLEKIHGSKGETLVLLNVHPMSYYSSQDMRLPQSVIKGIDGDALLDFAVDGGRVVIALEGRRDTTSKIWDGYRERSRELREERRKKQSGEDDTKKTKGKDTKPQPADKSSDDESDKDKDKKKKWRDEDDLPFKPAKSLRAALELGIDSETLSTIPKNGHVLKTPAGIAVLDGKLPGWLSQAFLDLAPPPEDDDDEDDSSKSGDAAKNQKLLSAVKEPWRILATVEGEPVLVERRIGEGSIVVATDTYFATNQAMLMHPAPEFLAWLIGDARHVIFDETHLGTQEDPGIMTLARRYRLHGFFLGGVLLFALFVWRSSSSLVPARDGAESGARMVAGQGAVAGLVSLLRRGVSRSRLLQTCFDQWVRNHPHPSPALQARIEKARALLPADDKRPSRGTLVVLYQRLCETLHPKRH